MLAVPCSEGETGEKLSCAICKKSCQEWYSLEPEGGEEYEKLEEELGDLSNWLVCADCLERAEKLLGCEIRLASTEEAAELQDRLYSEYVSAVVPEKAWKYIKNVRGREWNCPACGAPLEMEFEYMVGSEQWGGLSPFRSVTFSCSSCGLSMKEASPNPDEPLGYLIVGTILDFDDRLLCAEIAPPPPNVSRPKGFQIKEDKILVTHRCDPVLLETYKRLKELVEILVIRDVAVRVEG
jgi:rubredoxin